MTSTPDDLAYAVVRHAEPEVFAATDVDTLQWVLAVRLVAGTDPSTLDAHQLAALRQALLDEQWGTAVAEWIEITGVPVDVFPGGLRVESVATFSPEIAAAEMQFGALFRDG